MTRKYHFQERDLLLATLPFWLSLVIGAIARWPLSLRVLLGVLAIPIWWWLYVWLKQREARKRFQAGANWRSDQELLQALRGMKPSEFERYIANMFLQLGYKSQVVGQSHDGGIDVIAEKDGVKHYIQCKKFINRQVTLHDVRDFYGALASRLANCQGYFITTNTFTLEAREFANDKPIELVDGYRLVSYVRLANQDKKLDSGLTAATTETVKCPKCGSRLAERSGKYGKFIGCSAYPKCTYTRDV